MDRPNTGHAPAEGQPQAPAHLTARRNLARLRPSKVRSGIRRRWFEARVSHFRTKLVDSLIEVGTPYGAWIVSRDVDASWTCYCAGMGGDVSLERHLLAQGAVVRSVDPVERFVAQGLDELGRFDRYSAHHAALATHDGTIEMQQHHEAVSGSLSAADLYDTVGMVTVPATTLSSLMDDNGDTRVDLLKLDVEGVEYELVPALDLEALGVRLLGVQLHHNGSVADARRLIALIESQGFLYAAQRRPGKLTFVKREG